MSIWNSLAIAWLFALLTILGLLHCGILPDQYVDVPLEDASSMGFVLVTDATSTSGFALATELGRAGLVVFAGVPGVDGDADTSGDHSLLRQYARDHPPKGERIMPLFTQDLNLNSPEQTNELMERLEQYTKDTKLDFAGIVFTTPPNAIDDTFSALVSSEGRVVRVGHCDINSMCVEETDDVSLVARNGVHAILSEVPCKRYFSMLGGGEEFSYARTCLSNQLVWNVLLVGIMIVPIAIFTTLFAPKKQAHSKKKKS